MEPSSLSTRPVPPTSWRGGGDSRLVRQAARGDEAAFAAIFSRHHEALFRYCRSIVGNEHDATDALQSTMVKALEKLPGETRRIALRPWLFRIAHNESIDLLRARRPHADLDAAIDVSDRVSSTELETRERLHALEADLQRLTQQQRSALLLRELVGLSFAETAGALGITPSAAKQSVYEARQALHTREEGRAMDCDALCRSLSDGDRRTLRGKAVKAHLESCAGCRAFEVALRRRPTDLGLLAPLPAAGGLGGLGILGASAAGTAGVGAGAGAVAGGGFLSGVLPGLTATVGTKVAAALAVGAVAVGGVTVAERGGDGVTAGPDAAEAAQEGTAGSAGGAGSGDAAGASGTAAREGEERGVTGEADERPKLRGATDRRERVGAAGDDPDPSAGTPRSVTPNAETPSDAPPAADAPAGASTRDEDAGDRPGTGAARDAGRDAAADDDGDREATTPKDASPKPNGSKADRAKADKAKADKAKADKAKADKAKADEAKPEKPKDQAPRTDAPTDAPAAEPNASKPKPKDDDPDGQAPSPGAGSAPAGRPESPGKSDAAGAGKGNGKPKGGDEDEDDGDE